MNAYYKLRIDTSDREEVNRMCSKYFDKYMVAYENQDTSNAHVHLYIEMSTKADTLRRYIRKKFGSGNSCYSLKALDSECPIEYLAYIMKDNEYEIFDIPPTVIEEAKGYDKKVKEQMKEKKKARRTQLQILREMLVEQLVEEVDDSSEDVHRVFKTSGETVTKESIVNMIIAYYKTEKKLVREFMMVSLAQSLCLEFVPSYAYSFKNRILDKL